MRRLIVVRHAQSEANAVGSLHCTVPGPPLTDLGHEQAKTLLPRTSPSSTGMG
jgi:broad specificity phosphatase PhoE